MSALKSDGVTGVYAEALGPAAGYVLGARAKLGTNQSYLANAYVDIAPPTNGCIDLPGTKAMVANAAAAYATIGALPLYVAAFGWDATVLYHDVVAQAKSTDATTLASAIQNLSTAAQNDPLYTLSKRYFYSSSDHENLGVTPADYQIVKAGPVLNGQLHPTCAP